MTKIPALVLNTLNFAQYPTTHHSLDTSTTAIHPIRRRFQPNKEVLSGIPLTYEHAFI